MITTNHVIFEWWYATFYFHGINFHMIECQLKYIFFFKKKKLLKLPFAIATNHLDKLQRNEFVKRRTLLCFIACKQCVMFFYQAILMLSDRNDATDESCFYYSIESNDENVQRNENWWRYIMNVRAANTITRINKIMIFSEVSQLTGDWLI